MVRGSRQVERGHVSPAVAERPILDRPRSAVISAVSLSCRCSLSESPDTNVGNQCFRDCFTASRHSKVIRMLLRDWHA